ncbi:hypothetical protein JK320_25430 [Klebsiella pneumoniae]|uniref:hypothetical protein n=1 Tax=Klebsiella pneumoniae TaxID=573 RepID=UPI00191DE25A|nr:hypothetical protein [Klebsiella pneumoniae]MBL0830562.1 hypothetical protein [Klebsiella pneumoniae]
MTTLRDIKIMELRRLRELQLQAAQHGPHTDPGVLIEIQELRNKYPEVREVGSHPNDRGDYDFLMNVVAAALQRLTLLEQRSDKDDKRRINRQFIHDVWMITITVIAFATLLLVLAR